MIKFFLSVVFIFNTFLHADLVYVNNMRQLLSTNAKMVALLGFHKKFDNRVIFYRYDENLNVGKLHNGGDIIDPRKKFPVNWNDKSKIQKWFKAKNDEHRGGYISVNTEVNAKVFGAMGNTKTNYDDISINQAEIIAYKRGQSVVIPAGLYNISDTIFLLVDTKGDGRLNTKIQPTKNIDAIVISDVHVKKQFGKIKISDFMIRYSDIVKINEKEFGTSGIRVVGGYNFIFENLEIYRANTGFRIEGKDSLRGSSAEHSLRDITINHCWRGLYLDSKTYDVFGSNIPIEGSSEIGARILGGNHNFRHIHSTKNGIGYLLGDATSTYIDCHADTSKSTGWSIKGGYDNFIGCRSYNSGSNTKKGVGFYVDSSYNTFSNCTSNNTGKNTSQLIGLKFSKLSKYNVWLGGELSKNSKSALDKLENNSNSTKNIIVRNSKNQVKIIMGE